MTALLNNVMLEFQLMPESASGIAGRVDALYFFLVGVSTFFAALIFVLVIVFAIKYRQRVNVTQPAHPHVGNLKLEITWIVIPFILVMIMFGWGAKLYIEMKQPPANATEVFVVGKQWMWKLQHPTGRREINELHVPKGQPVRLTMISEDVIHSFYVPAFRMKQDVLPGYYTTTWFEPTRTGEYHLFCAEYCGTEHSRMIGKIIVMEPAEYQAWLAGPDAGQPMAAAGEQLFQATGCQACHNPESGARGPNLAGVFGKRVQIKDGGSVVANESYLRESILRPSAKVVYGYDALMPTYEGQLTEDQLLQIIAYLKSIGENPEATTRPAQ